MLYMCKLFVFWMWHDVDITTKKCPSSHTLYLLILFNYVLPVLFIWTASSEFGTYRLCEQRRFRRACASAQSCQNLPCSLIQAVNQEKPSDRKPDPWPLWMAGHAQLKFVMTECSKTQIRLTGPILLVAVAVILLHIKSGVTSQNHGIWVGITGFFPN